MGCNASRLEQPQKKGEIVKEIENSKVIDEKDAGIIKNQDENQKEKEIKKVKIAEGDSKRQ